MRNIKYIAPTGRQKLRNRYGRYTFTEKKDFGWQDGYGVFSVSESLEKKELKS